MVMSSSTRPQSSEPTPDPAAPAHPAAVARGMSPRRIVGLLQLTGAAWLLGPGSDAAERLGASLVGTLLGSSLPQPVGAQLDRVADQLARQAHGWGLAFLLVHGVLGLILVLDIERSRTFAALTIGTAAAAVVGDTVIAVHDLSVLLLILLALDLAALILVCWSGYLAGRRLSAASSASGRRGGPMPGRVRRDPGDTRGPGRSSTSARRTARRSCAGRN